MPKISDELIKAMIAGTAVPGADELKAIGRELKAARTLVKRVESMQDGCTVPKFAGYENGNGKNVGDGVDKALATYRAV